MNWLGAAFLMDENIHPEVVSFLRREGCDVLDVKESGLAGTTDLALLRRAVTDRRVILTHDSDFGTLVMTSGEAIYGILYLRPGNIRPIFTIEMLKTVFRQELSIEPPFILVAQRTDELVRIRVRSLGDSFDKA